VRAAHDVFDGERPLQQEGILVLPWRQVLTRLWSEELLG
jgi:hypothetical protein